MNPQALIHMAWWRHEQVRRLVFGWIEVLPNSVPYQNGHTWISRKVRNPDAHLYIGRFPMPAPDADRWFDEAASGRLILPTHPDAAPMKSSSKPILFSDPPGMKEPGADQESLALELPFLPYLHPAVHVCGLFGILSSVVANQITDAAQAAWLRDNLFFELADYPKFQGALIRTRYNSILRQVETQLSPRGDGDDQIVRLVTWPGADLTGMNILAVEKRPLGISEPIVIPVTSSVTKISWPNTVDQTALAVTHPHEGLCWWNDLQPFVRQIGLNFAVSSRQRRVEIRSDSGKLIDAYEVPEYTDERVITIGELPEPTSILEQHHEEERQRESRQTAARWGIHWFEDPNRAANVIRDTIRQAKKSLWIIDPYFTGIDMLRFVQAVTSAAVDIEIITSAEHLRTQTGNPRFPESGDSLADFLTIVQNETAARISVKVMPGSKSPVHDRFLIVDRRVFLSGNSLNAIGDRASVLLELPDPEFFITKLNPIITDAKPLANWLSERRATRSRPGLLKRAVRKLRDLLSRYC